MDTFEYQKQAQAIADAQDREIYKRLAKDAVFKASVSILFAHFSSVLNAPLFQLIDEIRQSQSSDAACGCKDNRQGL